MRSRGMAAALTVIAVVGLAASPAPVGAEEQAGLVSKIEALRPKARAAEPLGVRFTLTNTTSERLSVLKWQTPLEGFNDDVFRVERNGQPVDYIGRTVKRGAPQPQDYVTLEPGGSVSADVDLAGAYAIYEKGRYDVQFRSSLLDVGGATTAMGAQRKAAPLELRSNTVSLELVESKTAPPLPRALPPKPSTAEIAKTAKAKEPAFKNCSATQQSTLGEAHTKASQMAAGSVLALALTEEAKRPNAPRYKTWFGAYTAPRYATVVDHFSKIHGALVNETITFNCACNEGFYAYVYASKPYEIYLCNLFWPAPLEGTDSKGGTIIHETSHFNVVAATDDHAYGQTACKTLATNDPDKAIDNADSHEYFAENTPALAMGLAHLALGLLTILTILVAERLWRLRRRTA